MAQESIDNILTRIFKGRRYCSHCKAMTSVIHTLNAEHSEFCEMCHWNFDIKSSLWKSPLDLKPNFHD